MDSYFLIVPTSQKFCMVQAEVGSFYKLNVLNKLGMINY